MTARLIGAVLIGTVSLYTGGAFAALWQRRVEQLTAFCRLTAALRDGIGIMGLPVQDIVLVFADPCLEKTGFLPELRRIWQEDPTADALTDAFAVCSAKMALEEEDTALLTQFFAAVGSEDRVREGERCGYTLSRLQTLRDDAADALPARCRIARTLAGALGCAAVLMLL